MLRIISAYPLPPSLPPSFLPSPLLLLLLILSHLLPSSLPRPAAKHYEEAIDYYSQAIELNPTVAAFYANRSFSHLKMESYGFALADADTALGLDRGYIKAGGGRGRGEGGEGGEGGKRREAARCHYCIQHLLLRSTSSPSSTFPTSFISSPPPPPSLRGTIAEPVPTWLWESSSELSRTLRQ